MPTLPEESEQTPQEEPVIGTPDVPPEPSNPDARYCVYDRYLRLVRIYTTADHGADAEKLARQFATKITGIVKVE